MAIAFAALAAIDWADRNRAGAPRARRLKVTPGAEAAAARRRPAPAAMEAGRIEVERNLQVIVTMA